MNFQGGPGVPPDPGTFQVEGNPETETGKLETEKRVHRIHGTLETGLHMMPRSLVAPSRGCRRMTGSAFTAMDVALPPIASIYLEWGGGLGEGWWHRWAWGRAGGFLKIGVLPAWELHLGVIWLDTRRHPFGGGPRLTFGLLLVAFGVFFSTIFGLF